VGTVYIALSTPERTVAEQFRFAGTRHMIQTLAAETALDLLRLYLVSERKDRSDTILNS
jgi:nicotinamide mononucleotide (NMN) deamidase PncC